MHACIHRGSKRAVPNRHGNGGSVLEAWRLPPNFSAAAPMFAEIGYDFVAEAPPLQVQKNQRNHSAILSSCQSPETESSMRTSISSP